MICFCESCHEFFDERRMATETMCELCKYGKEVMESGNPTELKAQGDRAVPGEEDGREKEGTALSGQLSLSI